MPARAPWVLPNDEARRRGNSRVVTDRQLDRVIAFYENREVEESAWTPTSVGWRWRGSASS
jgi:hypothetical protein